MNNQAAKLVKTTAQLSLKLIQLRISELHIRLAASSADWEIAHQMLDEEHFLGAGCEAGERLCQFVMEEGKVVAVLIWCAAAWHL